MKETGLSRREFVAVALAGMPLAVTMRPRSLAARGSFTVGVTTSSLRELPRVTGKDNVDDVLRALRVVGATHVDLALANIEPAPPSVAPFVGGSAAYPRRVILSAEEILSTNREARAGLREWRMNGASAATFERVRSQFAAAGITVNACSIGYDRSFDDDEIDATFRQVKSLGVNVISSPLTMETASRLVPFAQRHKMSIAVHNDVDGNAGGQIATADIPTVLALSPFFSLKLDVGNLTASNCDAVAELRTVRARVSHVVLKDRLRSGGKSLPFGEGDTPIQGVLRLLETFTPAIPAFVEYDYAGLRPAADEITESLRYVAQHAS